MNLSNQLDPWFTLYEELKLLSDNPDASKWNTRFKEIQHLTEVNNPWFTAEQQLNALNGIIHLLEPSGLQNWIKQYHASNNTSKKIGVIMAGNIPMAGFHDMLCVILSGHHLHAKLSSSDNLLLPFITEVLGDINNEFLNYIHFTDQLNDIDALIATGSNNTSRYFDYYFGKKPHIFRKNRSSVAVITGEENEYDFVLLGKDIFTYYGLGCRSISKLFIPEGYVFDDFFENIISYETVMKHSKYMNNFDYHQSLYLLNRQPFLTNNFIIVTESKDLSSPVGVLYYETFSNEEDLQIKIELIKDQTQCVVRKNSALPPGKAQSPGIGDFADGVDTMKFLLENEALV